MTNSVDLDQLASSEANWSGSTLFAKAGYVYSGSAEQGLKPEDQWSCSLPETIVLSKLKVTFLKNETVASTI